MIHEIERLRGPRGQLGWFATLDRADQVELMAWYRVHVDPVGERRKPQGKRGRERAPSRGEARAKAGR